MLPSILLIAAALHGSPAPLPGTEIVVPLPGEVVHAAVAVGLTPHALAASGLSVQQAQAIGAGLTASTEEVQALTAAEGVASEAAERLSAVLDQIARRPGDAELSGQLEAARAAMRQAADQVDATRTAVRAVVLENAPQEAAARLSAFGANPTDLPAELRVVPWTQEQVRVLRRAIVTARRALRHGQDVPADAAAVLSEARSNPAVINAEAGLAGRLASMRDLLAAP